MSQQPRKLHPLEVVLNVTREVVRVASAVNLGASCYLANGAEPKLPAPRRRPRKSRKFPKS